MIFIRFLIFSCLIFLKVYAYSQPFQETILSSNFTDPYAIECIDLNKDTYDDIVVSGLNELSWFKNTNGLNFNKIIIIDTISSIVDFKIVDFDNDTLFDIVCITSGKLFWLENDGNMNFVYHLITDTLDNARKMKAVDIDNDGDIDILFSLYDNFYDIYLYQNNGTGFTDSYIDRVDYNGIYIVDYNNDGYIDLLTKTNYYPFTTEELAILINNGSNAFAGQQIYEKTGDIDITDAQFTFINNDGAVDLLIADNIQKEIYWLQSCTTRFNILTSQYVRSVLAHDFNKDGTKDIVFKYEYSGSYKFFALQGTIAGSSVNFTQVLDYNLGASSNYILPFEANADTCPDFAYISDARDEVAYLENENNFNFSLKKLATAITLPESMIRADLDQDGDQDIVSISSNNEIIWLDQQPDSSFQQKIISSALDNPIQIAVDDINADGFFDIITASIGDDDFSIWYNDGNQNFTEFFLTSSQTQLSNPSYFNICDLDNDNDKDFIIIASSTSTTSPKGIFWIKNLGNGTFSAPIVIKNNLNLMGEVIVHDFDNDGNKDIIVANHEQGSSGLQLIKNNNNATSFTITTPVSFRAVGIRKGDINGDGLMDFVTRNDDDNDIVWFESHGNLTFTPHTIIMNENRDVRFEICDAGNDGITDILFYEFYFGYTNSIDFNIGLLKNDGFENFTQTYFIENLYNILSAIPADDNMDGDIDLFLGIDINDKISFFENKEINLIMPIIIAWPVASGIIYGDTLGVSVLSGGSASVPGYFSFTNPAIIPNAGIYQASVTFFPYQDSIYSILTGQTSVSVQKADPLIYEWPLASDITYGNTLSASVLSGDSTSVPGIFTFNNPNTTPPLGVYTADVTFTPADTSNYNPLNGTINVTVVKATPLINQWPTASIITCGDSVGNAVLSNGIASVNGVFVFDNPGIIPSVGIYSADVSFIPNDSVHYNTVVGSVNVTIKGLDTTIINDNFCEGSTYNFFGTTLYSNGSYYQTLTSQISGCDSIIQLDLFENSQYDITENVAICSGESINWHGNNYAVQGIYYDSLTSVHGCDSVYILNLTVNDLPLVSLSGLNNFYCIYSAFVPLSGSPAGGSFSGMGVSSNSFNPLVAGIGTWPIVYSYSDVNNCFNSDTVIVVVDECVGTGIVNKQDIKVYPNPCKGVLTIEGSEIKSIWITDLKGITVFQEELQENTAIIDLSLYPKAVYILKIFTDHDLRVAKIVLQ